MENIIDEAGIPHYYYKDEDCVIWLTQEELRSYSFSFAPLPDCLRGKLGCRGVSGEIFRNRLWNIGTYGQGARNVYLARNPGTDKAVMERLRQATPASLVLQFGNTSTDIPLDSRQVFDLAGLMEWRDGCISFNASPIAANVEAQQAENQLKERMVHARTAHQDGIEMMLRGWFRAKYENAKRCARGEEARGVQKRFAFSTQEGLAKAMRISKAAVTRAKAKWEEDLFGNGGIYLELIRNIDIEGTDAILDLYWRLKPGLTKIGIEYE